jgi:hypothetical protein
LNLEVLCRSYHTRCHGELGHMGGAGGSA